MENCDDGDLKTKIIKAKTFKTAFSLDQIVTWFTQLCMAVKRVHDSNIIHRDIKPSNIFHTSKGLIKLGDFGVSKKLNERSDLALSCAGTLEYMAPEVVHSVPYSFEADIWSLGITLYKLCNLRHPFEDIQGNFLQYFRAMFKGDY